MQLSSSENGKDNDYPRTLAGRALMFPALCLWRWRNDWPNYTAGASLHQEPYHPNRLLACRRQRTSMWQTEIWLNINQLPATRETIARSTNRQ
jgi:hypothetical protein